VFGIAATSADVVAVLRRGPSDWFHLGRWQPAARRFDAGSWLRAAVYPRRCELSPDGQLLLYRAFQGSARWSIGPNFRAVSQLPTFTAQAAWEASHWGELNVHFVAEPGRNDLGPPAAGSTAGWNDTIGVAIAPHEMFAVERRRG
jgi:hypothetical protein